MELEPRPSESRIAGLDGLRAIAVGAVLVVHVGYYGREWFDGGRLGVQMFFVLSGYLITALLVREFDRSGTIGLRDFYLRRAARLLPALGAVIVALLAVVAAGLIPGSTLAATWHETFAVITYWDNWYRAYKVGPATWIDHCWSLSVEEQFYVVWPPLLLLGLRFGRRFLLPGVVAVLLGSILARIVMYPYVPQHRLYFGTDTRVDGLAAGCALALVAARGGLRRLAPLLRSLALPAVALLAVLGHFMTINTPGTYYYGFVLCDLATVVLVGVVVAGVTPKPLRLFLEQPAVAYVGRISYGFYLWHWPIFGLIAAHVGALQFRELVPLEVGISFAVAAASYHLLEQPVIAWSRRRRRVEAVPVPAPVD